MARSAGPRASSDAGGSRQFDGHGRDAGAGGRRVGAGERQRLGIPVGGQGLGAAERRDDRGQADAAPQLHDARPGEGQRGQALGQHDRARPELGPVGQALVARERLLVDELLGAARAQDAEDRAADLDLVADRVERQ